MKSLGLQATCLGPTTIKQRMATAQHKKSGRIAIDEEDYIITLTKAEGGLFQLINPTIGFDTKKPSIEVQLPNIYNLSDHYPVGANLIAK